MNALILAATTAGPLDTVLYMAVTLTMVVLANLLPSASSRFAAVAAFATLAVLAVASGNTAFAYIILGGAVGLGVGTFIAESIYARH